MLTQIEELKSFIAQATTSNGKGPSCMTHGMLSAKQLRRTTIHRYLWESIKGTFVNKRKLKKGRGNVYKTMHVGLERQLQEAQLFLAEKNADVPIDCSPPCGQEPPEENFQEFVLLAGLGVIKCHSCKGEIKKKKCPPSKDLAFHMQVASHMERPKNKGIVLMLWKYLPPLHHAMCKNA